MFIAALVAVSVGIRGTHSVSLEHRSDFIGENALLIAFHAHVEIVHARHRDGPHTEINELANNLRSQKIAGSLHNHAHAALRRIFFANRRESWVKDRLAYGLG